MGDGKWGNQYRRKNNGRGGSGGGSSDDSSQTQLTSYKGFSHIDRSDVNDFLLPVLKEVGKAVCPPAAITIELLYQLYKHADAIKDVGLAVMKGDYEGAAKVMIREGVKEVGGAVVGAAIKPGVAKVSDSLEEAVSNSLPAEQQEKEVAGKAVKGIVNGVAEASSDKIVDTAVNKVVERVIDNERKKIPRGVVWL
jgi:hypothetical protein